MLIKESWDLLGKAAKAVVHRIGWLYLYFIALWTALACLDISRGRTWEPVIYFALAVSAVIMGLTRKDR